MTLQRVALPAVLVILAVVLAVGAVVTNPGAQAAWQNLTSSVRTAHHGASMIVVRTQGSAAHVSANGLVNVAFTDTAGFPQKPPKCPDGSDSVWEGYTPAGQNGEVTLYAKCGDGGYMYQNATRTNGGPLTPAH